jgi:hypothetical protein
MDACIEGAPEDVVAPDGALPSHEPADPEGIGLVEMGVPPAALGAVVRRLDEAGETFEAWMGTGICRVAVTDAREVASVRALATEHGGRLPTLRQPDGRLVPRDGLYRVRLRLDEPPPQAVRGAVAAGTVSIEAEPRNLLLEGARSVASVLVRESGF